jgi:plasmid stabilization system protein ParE
LALSIRVKPRAEREIQAAAQWWKENRPAVPGAIRSDLQTAMEILVEQPDIGRRVENARDPRTRRLFLKRTRYFVYYRPIGKFLEIIAFWHASREHGPLI